MKKSRINVGSIGAASTNWGIKNARFLLYIFVFFIFSIGLTHYSDNQMKRIDTLHKELEDAKSSTMDYKVKILRNSQMSVLEHEMQNKNIYSNKSRLKKIVNP
jgi:Bacteriodetes cell division protein (FtsL-like)